MAEIYNDPSHVTASDGHVVVKGPDAVSVSVTPEAAVETASRLIEGAAAAEGRRRLKADAHQRRQKQEKTDPPE